ncbi:MAG: hypothetical protein ACP5JS_04960 [Fervidobacterium sp.]
MLKFLKSERVWIAIIGLIALTFLILSLSGLKRVFFIVRDIRLNFDVTEVKVNGINLEIKSKLSLSFPKNDEGLAQNTDIEIVQIKVFDDGGNYLGSWNGNVQREGNGKYVLNFSFSDVKIFEENKELDKFNIEGFAKVKMNVGRYGLKINVPLKAEVSNFGKD